MSAKGEAAWARHIGREAAERLYHPERFRPALRGRTTSSAVSTPSRRRRSVDTAAIARLARIATRAATTPIVGGFGALAGAGTRKRKRRR